MTKYKSQAKRASILKRMNSGLTESEFIDLIAQSQTDSKSYSEDEHHMAEWLINKKWKKWKVANVSYFEEQNLEGRFLTKEHEIYTSNLYYLSSDKQKLIL